MQELGIWSLSQEDPLEKDMAAHSSILAWEMPRTEKPGRLPHKVTGIRHNLATKHQQMWQAGTWGILVLEDTEFQKGDVGNIL